MVPRAAAASERTPPPMTPVSAPAHPSLPAHRPRNPPRPRRAGSARLRLGLMALALCGTLTAGLSPAWAGLVLDQGAAVADGALAPDAPGARPPAARSSAPILTPVPVITGAQLRAVPYAALPGWARDDAAAAFATFLHSCAALAQPPAEIGPVSSPVLRAGLNRACAAARSLRTSTPSGLVARLFFEANFQPFAILPQARPTGFLTGYYEPEVEGSRVPTDTYTVPVYGRPPDLVPVRPQADGNKGAVFRNDGTRLVPYWNRAAIEDGALAGRGLEICWLKDPVDLFFMQIQGSARVRLPDGGVLRLNYDGHNGQPYVPVGRLLIERGQVPREQMSMDRIRAFMEADPVAGRALRRENPSFVFFRAVPLAAGEGALGAQGVGLTAGRSIAVDRELHTYGTPIFIDARLPLRSEVADTPFQHLMIAQDTGSAIVGPARADIFFGAGDQAARIAGRLRDPGNFFLLLPRLSGGAVAP